MASRTHILDSTETSGAKHLLLIFIIGLELIFSKGIVEAHMYIHLSFHKAPPCAGVCVCMSLRYIYIYISRKIEIYMNMVYNYICIYTRGVFVF